MGEQKDKIFTGMTCAAVAIALLAVQSVCAKTLAQNGQHVIEIAFFRSLIALIPFFIWLVVNKKLTLLSGIKKPWTLTARVVNGIIGLAITFAALKHLPIADASVLFFASVIIAPILSFLFLKERVGIRRWSAIAVGMTGVIIAASPSWQISIVGLLFGLCASFMQATTCTLLRSLKGESSIAVTFYFFFGGSILAAIALPFVWSTPTLDQIPLFLLLGTSGGAAQLLLAFSFRFAPTSIIMPFQYTGLIWAVIFDFTIWSVFPAVPVFIGSGIIIASHIYIVYRERINYLSNK